MRNLKEIMYIREKELLNLIRMKQKQLKTAVEGTLYANQHDNTVQFYLGISHRAKKYLRKDDPLITQLVQKEYDKSVLDSAEQEIGLIGQLTAFYERKDDPESQYERMLSVKRPHVKPIREPDDEYVRKWLAEPYPKLEIEASQGEYPNYYNDEGVKMRSKSELIIADLLRKKRIPYRHEYPLNLMDPETQHMKTIYPDFMILRVRDRKVLFWEHLGLLEKPDYFRKNLSKIRTYEMNGYLPGYSLIISFETSFAPLSIKLIEQMIEAYCM